MPDRHPRCRRHTIAHLREEAVPLARGMRLVESRADHLGLRVRRGVVAGRADEGIFAPGYTYHCVGCGIDPGCRRPRLIG